MALYQMTLIFNSPTIHLAIYDQLFLFFPCGFSLFSNGKKEETHYDLNYAYLEKDEF